MDRLARALWDRKLCLNQAALDGYRDAITGTRDRTWTYMRLGDSEAQSYMGGYVMGGMDRRDPVRYAGIHPDTAEEVTHGERT